MVFFTENLSGGGVEKIQHIILKHWDYNTYDVTLYSLRDESLSAKRFFPHITDYKYVFESILDIDKPIEKLWKKIKNKIRLFVYYHFSPKVFYQLFIRKSYDVGISFIEGYATRILSGAPSCTRKTAWIHTELQKNHWTTMAYKSVYEEELCYKTYKYVACVSKEIKRQADEMFGIHDKTIVLYNPTDKTDISVKSALCISEKLPIARPLIVTLGRLEKEKGYPRLLNVAKRLKQVNDVFTLWIIGDGNERDKLSKQIIDHQLGNCVFLLGYKPNPYPYLLACDFYVCSSYAEGYNTAITEALVLGKPVVSTNCSGVSDQLGDSEYGIITKNNEDSLYEGVKRMLDSSVRNDYKAQVEKRKSHFNLDKQMKEIIQLIEKS